MAVSAAERRYLLQQANQLAQNDLNALWAQAARLGTGEFFEFVKGAFPELATAFFDMAGSLSATWFELSDEASTYRAITAPLPPVEKFAASAEWALGANGDVGRDRLTGTLQRAVFDGARATTLVNIERTQSRWIRHARPDACTFCRMLATRHSDPDYWYTSNDAALQVGGGGRSRGSRDVGEKYHDNCVPGGTLVSGPRTESAYRRLYEGEAVVIDTASGQQLTITPNHPVLTDQGWVPAGLLQRGDNVVRTTVCDAGAAAVPDEHQQPALIQDVWGSLAVNGLARVPGSAKNFHGDGLDGEVQIVSAYRDLSSRRDAAFLEEGKELLFAGAGGARPRPPLTVLRQIAPGFPTSGGAAHSVLSGTNDSGPFVCGHPLHTELLRLCDSTRGNAQLEQATTDYDARRSESFSDFKFGQLLIDVERPQTFRIDHDPVATRFDPAGLEFTGQGRGVYASRGLDLLASLTSQVQLDSVIECRRIGFSGHVYNLQTRNGWYSADSLIVSNCHCIAVEVREGQEYDPPEYVQKWDDEYEKAAANAGSRGDVKAIQAAWRQLLISQ